LFLNNSTIVIIPPYPSIDNFLFFEGLKHNLLSISKLCGSGYDVSCKKDECIIQNNDGSLLFFAKRKGNQYKIRLGELSYQNVSCLLFVRKGHWVWHKKLGHASLRLISMLQKHNLVKGLSSMSYNGELLCETGQKGKPVKCSCFHLEKFRTVTSLSIWPN